MLDWIKEMECTKIGVGKFLALKCTQNRMARVFLWLGKQMFGYIAIHPQENPKSFTFSESERHHLASARDLCDAVDEEYKK